MSISHLKLLTLVLLSSSLNAIAFGAFMTQAFGLNQQGKRLELLAKERDGRGVLVNLNWKTMGYCHRDWSHVLCVS